MQIKIIFCSNRHCIDEILLLDDIYICSLSPIMIKPIRDFSYFLFYIPAKIFKIISRDNNHNYRSMAM